MTELNNFLCFKMRAAMKKLDRNLGQKLEEYGISIPQSFILKTLVEENGITLKEIGNRTLIDSSSMTVLIDKLEKDDLVERQLDAQDRRAIRIYITEKGLNLADEVSSIAEDFNIRVRQLVSAENQEAFLAGINNIIIGLD